VKTVVKKDPKMRRDLRCTVCGEKLPPVAIENEDPFCSTPCCHSFHGVEIQAKTPGVPVGASA
jgi:hypothetical protein